MRAVQEIVMLQFHVVAFTKKVWSIRALLLHVPHHPFRQKEKKLNAKELFLPPANEVAAR